MNKCDRCHVYQKHCATYYMSGPEVLGSCLAGTDENRHVSRRDVL